MPFFYEKNDFLSMFHIINVMWHKEKNIFLNPPSACKKSQSGNCSRNCANHEHTEKMVGTKKEKKRMLGTCRSSKVGKDITRSFTLTAAMMLFDNLMCFLFNPKCMSNFFLDIALISNNPVSPVFSLDKSVVVISTYVLTSFIILSQFFPISVGSDVARYMLRIEDRHADLSVISCWTCIIAIHSLSE